MPAVVSADEHASVFADVRTLPRTYLIAKGGCYGYATTTHYNV
jgi:hypothetical protein